MTVIGEGFCRGVWTERRTFLAGSAVLAAGALIPLEAAAREGTIRELTGEVIVNGKAIGSGAGIGAWDTVYTKAGSSIWFTIGGDGFFLRGGSELRLEAGRARDALVTGLRLLSGALGATFARGAARNVIARTVTIGIRGTGIYLETTPEESYACTCFGATELKSNTDGSMMESVSVVTGSHFARRIFRDPKMGMRVVEAPFERHTSEEIARLEALNGRGNPFAGAKG